MLTNIFDSEKGRAIYDSALKAIRDFEMESLIGDGVLLGFSGGPDSVMLLAVFMKLKQDGWNFPLKAVHVNHMIRGKEADADEQFSQSFCAENGVDFEAFKVDIPKIAREQGRGIEEAARSQRYDIFNTVLARNNELNTIAVAHNATDNLETVIFNLMRGTGLSGIAGIPPKRDRIIRPLFYSSKSDIMSALNDAGIPYVIDSTNTDVQYSRNYIRSEIIPRLAHINPEPEKMASRLSLNLRNDIDFINSAVDDFMEKCVCNGVFSINSVVNLPKSIFARVVTKLFKQKTDKTLESVHINAIHALLPNGSFSYSLPAGLAFVSDGEKCYISDTASKSEAVNFQKKLSYGVNTVPGFSTAIIISQEKKSKNFSNIYKISIEAKVPRDIIDNGLFVRQKNDGDSYRYGGMTHKLKRMFSDKKIPIADRWRVPVFCDNNGIVWVPGFPIRDHDKECEYSYIALAEPIEQSSATKFFFKTQE